MEFFKKINKIEKELAKLTTEEVNEQKIEDLKKLRVKEYIRICKRAGGYSCRMGYDFKPYIPYSSFVNALIWAMEDAGMNPNPKKIGDHYFKHELLPGAKIAYSIAKDNQGMLNVFEKAVDTYELSLAQGMIYRFDDLQKTERLTKSMLSLADKLSYYVKMDIESNSTYYCPPDNEIFSKCFNARIIYEEYASDKEKSEKIANMDRARKRLEYQERIFK